MVDFAQPIPGLKKLDDGQSQIKLKDIDIDLNRGRPVRRTDFGAEVNRMARGAAGGSTASLAVRMQAFDVDVGLVAGSLGIALDNESKLLAQARAHVGRAEYEPALKCLGELLTLNPTHVDGLYLKGLCLFSLNQYTGALKTLLPLNKLDMSKRMATKVRDLRSQIRDQIKRNVIGKLDQYLREKQYDKASNTMRELLEMDPHASLYYYLLAGTLMKQGEIRGAIDLVQEGLEQGDEDDRNLLVDLKATLEIYLLRDLEPARALFKRNKHKKALQLLQELPANVRALTVCIAFEQFLRPWAETGGFLSLRKRPALQSMATSVGTPDLEALYAFLADPEATEAKGHIERKQFRDAERLLQPLVEIFPDYPYLHYLYACAVYKGRVDTTNNTVNFSFDDLLKRLRLAETHAEIGARDKEHKAADELYVELLKINEVLRLLEDQVKQAILVNAAIEEFMRILNPLTRGQIDIVIAHRMKSDLQAFERKLNGISNQVTNPQALGAVEQLKQVTREILAQLGMKGI